MAGWIGRFLSNFGGSVGVSSGQDEHSTARRLFAEVAKIFDPANYTSTDIFDYAIEMAFDLSVEFDITENVPLVHALADCLEPLIISNAILPPEVNWDNVDHQGEEGLMLRRYLERHKRFHANFAVNNARFRNGIHELFSPILSDLPDLSTEEQDTSRGFGIALGDLLRDHRANLDQLIRVPFNPDLQEARLFEDLRDTVEGNICAVSGIDRRNAPSSPHRYRMPRDFTGSRQDCADAFLRFTPFKKLLKTPLPFTVPREARFEHTHIVGGTGHGKTQLLSHFILRDLVDIALGRRKSLVVIDSQGDLIRKISSMLLFNPGGGNGMDEKLVIIDPHDIDHPTAINIFHIDQDRLNRYGPAERERVFNGAVELYEHFFAGLLGADLTQKQGVAFSYLARLMLEMPNATLLTLRDLMDDPEPFRDQIAQLSGSSRMFFEREFLTKSFAQTRRQISHRLWSILAIPAFERMFSQTEHKVDLFDLLNSGKVILINTSQALLKKEGSAIFGKFFMAAISQAIGERAVLPEDQRTETIIYLDEAQEYANESLEVLLNQGRKYKAGIVIAHQFQDQLNAMTRQTLLANASIKIVGGLSHKDNQAFAREMGTDTEFLSSLTKHESSTEFGLWIKHQIPQALRLKVPFGLLESAVRLDGEGKQAQLVLNRRLYAAAPALTAALDITPTVTGDPPTEGRGGSQHRELQQLIKRIGHDLGLGAQIEAKCQRGVGAIDVLLTGEQTAIAVEISIKTSPEHEVENLRKCLQEDVDLVLCVSPNDHHRLAIQNLSLEALPQSQSNRIKFLNPSALGRYLTQFDERETTLIRGYEVAVRTAPGDPDDIAYRENRLKRLLNENF